MAANVRMDDGGRIAEVGKESGAFFEGLLGMGLRRFAGLSRFLGRVGGVLPGRMALCGKEVLWGRFRATFCWDEWDGGRRFGSRRGWGSLQIGENPEKGGEKREVFAVFFP